MKNPAAPLDNTEFRNKLEEILIRYGVDYRVVHAPLHQIDELLREYNTGPNSG